LQYSYNQKHSHCINAVIELIAIGINTSLWHLWFSLMNFWILFSLRDPKLSINAIYVAYGIKREVVWLRWPTQ